MRSDRQARRLIDATHRAALNPAAWQDVVAELGTIVGESPIALHSVDVQAQQAVATAAWGFHPDFLETYLAHFAELSPWPQRFLGFPQQQALEVSEMGLPAEFKATEFYQDWVRPQEDISTGAAIRTRSIGPRSLVAGINIRARDQDKLERGAKHLLNWLEPFLAHAFAVNEEIARIATASWFDLSATVASEPIDRPASGFIVVNDQRFLVWADGGASALFGSLLRMSATGRLSFDAAAAQYWFEKVALAAQGNGPDPELRFDWRGKIWILRSVPCEDDFAGPPAFPGLNLWKGESGRAMALILTEQRVTQSHQDRLRRVFGLSAAEAAVALAVAEGRTTDEIAQSRMASRATVRNQIQSVLSKMDAHNRGDVIRIISRLLDRPANGGSDA